MHAIARIDLSVAAAKIMAHRDSRPPRNSNQLGDRFHLEFLHDPAPMHLNGLQGVPSSAAVCLFSFPAYDIN